MTAPHCELDAGWWKIPHLTRPRPVVLGCRPPGDVGPWDETGGCDEDPPGEESGGP
jgi:hypothetical protein